MNETNERTTTCQICGRPIKSKNGLIAHHGYTRPGDGWQTSSCLGARFAPYEIASERIVTVIDSLEAFIVNQTEHLADFEQNPPAVLIGYVKGRSAWDYPTRVEYARPDDFTLKSYDAIPRTYANEHASYRRQIRRNIEGARGQLDYLKKRLAEWKAPNA